MLRYYEVSEILETAKGSLVYLDADGNQVKLNNHDLYLDNDAEYPTTDREVNMLKLLCVRQNTLRKLPRLNPGEDDQTEGNYFSFFLFYILRAWFICFFLLVFLVDFDLNRSFYDNEKETEGKKGKDTNQSQASQGSEGSREENKEKENPASSKKQFGQKARPANQKVSTIFLSWKLQNNIYKLTSFRVSR